MPAMFRRFGFRWAETLPGVESFVDGHGSHMDVEQTLGVLTKHGYDPKATYLIDVKACSESSFDPLRIAAKLGITI
jgi:hypothetical protein